MEGILCTSKLIVKRHDSECSPLTLEWLYIICSHSCTACAGPCMQVSTFREDYYILWVSDFFAALTVAASNIP